MSEQEKALLLSVARILRNHMGDNVNDRFNYIHDDLKALVEALKPFESNIVNINPNSEKNS